MSVSVACAVMGREAALLVSLNSWLSFGEIDEILIINWGCLHDLDYLLDRDGRIVIADVPDRDQFYIAAAYNLGFDLTTSDTILKLDADYILNPYYRFFQEHEIQAGEFLSGAGSSRQPNHVYKGLNGLLWAHTKDIYTVSGYDERMRGWGSEDIDLYKRLEASGLEHKKINPLDNRVLHIPHPISQRYEFYAEKDIRLTNKSNAMLSKSDSYQGRLLQWDCVPRGRKIECRELPAN